MKTTVADLGSEPLFQEFNIKTRIPVFGDNLRDNGIDDRTVERHRDSTLAQVFFAHTGATSQGVGRLGQILADGLTAALTWDQKLLDGVLDGRVCNAEQVQDAVYVDDFQVPHVFVVVRVESQQLVCG